MKENCSSVGFFSLEIQNYLAFAGADICVTYMKQIPREANSHSDTQEILRLLWNPKVH
jgi:hypothetical protein